MKKTVIYILLLTIFLSFAACDKPEVPESTPPANQDTQPQDTQDTYVPEPVYENTYAISMPITHEYSYDELGNVIFDYSYQSIHLIIPDKDVADKIIIDFLTRIDKSHTDADDLLQYAQDGSSVPCSYQIQYDATRIDQGVLSLYGHIIQVSDAMHADYKCISANYDMVTGDVLTLGSILYHADQKDELASLVIDALESNTTISLYDDYKETVTNRFLRDESVDEDFFFTATGLRFYFSPYEIAPYSAGTIVAEIPYNKLTGIIGDAYFPAEKTYSYGDISIVPFDEAVLENYEQFVEIIADPSATKILLTTSNSVHDIQIKQLSWDSTGSQIIVANTIFASNVLNQADGILFEANFEQNNIAYMVTYSKAGASYDFYFAYDNGNITLTNAID